MTHPLAGFGLGMRRQHYADYVAGAAPVDFIEVISENFMVEGGRPLDTLTRARSHYPLALHGVSLSIGSAHGLDRDYLAQLKALVARFEPAVVSDHLCWTATPGFNSHDLLPVPYTEEALALVCGHLDQVQNTLGRQFLIENPSSYCQFPGDLTEWEFMAALVDRTGCGLLLDVNNIYVSACNHGFDPLAYLDGLPLHAVAQIHLAGHVAGEDLLIDTHDQPVCAEVWDLYRETVRRTGAMATMIERDGNIPALDELTAELDDARGHAAAALALEAVE